MNLRSFHFAVCAGLLGLCGAIPLTSSVHATGDPALNPTLTASNPDAVVSWFGSNGVPYQVQSSSNLVGWTDSSLVVTGAGGPLFFTNPIAGGDHRFFRIKRLPVPDLSAVFDLGILTVIGNDLDNTIVVSRDIAGTLYVNNGTVPITGSATVANTLLIRIYGRAGHDDLSIDASNGSMPRPNCLARMAMTF